jgi:RND family efflux transporter MFP subunit
MEFNDQLTLVGRTRAMVQSNIVSEVAGRVQKINAREGVKVSRGDILITLDPDRINFGFEAKQAAALQAEAQAELAGKNLEREKEMYAQDLISDSRLDSVSAAAQVARQRYQELKAEMEELRLDLANTEIRAPFDGYTGLQLVEVGEWVTTGTPVYEMTDPSQIKVIVDLPERHYGKLSRGNQAVVMISGEEDKPLTGTVTGISPAASGETHTFPVILTVPNPDNLLAGGMLVRATLSLDRSFESLAVSKDAIVRQGMQTMVYTIAEGKAAPVPVTTSSTDGKMVAVTGPNLSAGMPVVVRGNERIFPGAPVRTPGQGQGQGQGGPPADGPQGGAAPESGQNKPDSAKSEDQISQSR